ncbi:MAG: 3-dehydroquinate synthase [Acidobacteriota bacterium]
MKTVDVVLPGGGARCYKIGIGVTLPHAIAEDLLEFAAPPRWAIISDDMVAPLYAYPLAHALRAAGATVDCFDFPAGEAAKSRDTVAQLQDSLIGKGCRRDSWIVGVGGGVAGDLAGYVAATLFRGIAYVQVPTTLLAMVDSSIGGKTGIDTSQGKNLVGAIHQPRRVLVDVSTLDSLPEGEMSAGLAEVIKYGVILDAALFTELEEGLVEVCLERSQPQLEALVVRCCRLKASVVEADETESDLRQVLNFGHTVAHAIETVLGYGLRHGEAVAIGMVAEARLAQWLVGAAADLPVRIEELCRRAGLPTRLPAGCAVGEVIDAAHRDKKVRAGQLRCALPSALGQMATGPSGSGIPVEPAELEAAIR